MFNIAKMDGLIKNNPFDGVKRLPVEERDRVSENASKPERFLGRGRL